MATLPPPASGPYRLIAERLPTSPIIMRHILESWCNLNCTGAWEAKIEVTQTSEDAPEKVRLDLHTDDDAVLFMLSPEYGYMGCPPVKPLTI